MPPDFATLYEQLLTADVSRRLPSPGSLTDGLIGDPDLAFLLGRASQLALSADPDERTAAYEIATRSLTLRTTPAPGVVAASDFILSRLGNFPGRSLLRKRHAATGRQTQPVLALEELARELENTIPRPGDRQLALTDFQTDVLRALQRESSLSISAPTSAGKSFIFTLEIVRRLQEGPEWVVYVVPTRALMRQIVGRLIRELNDAGLRQVPVRSVPIPLDPADHRHGAVFVLTQERLLSYLNPEDGEPRVSILVVDEAQGIMQKPRGIILHSSIEHVLSRFPSAELYFAGPLLKNPKHFLELFGRSRTGRPMIEQHSPVSQNVILASPVKSHTTAAKFELLLPEKRIDLGVRELGFKWRGTAAQERAAFARAITRDRDATIVYANGPKQAEKIAVALAESLQPPTNAALTDFQRFLAEHVHPEYSLIKVIGKGVGFHYGYMPTVVRSQVERLFEEGHLRFICCTSTLLQGVNLPARNIVIESPKSGRDQPMSRADFLNLAGRAGRLLKEFHGNVWCLNADEWDPNILNGPRLVTVTSAMEDVLADGGTLIQQAVRGEVPEGKEDLANVALGKIYSEYIVEGISLDQTQYATPENRAELQRTTEACEALQITLPKRILKRNGTMNPLKLQKLYDEMLGVDDPAALTPIKPFAPNANTRLKEIIERTERVINESHENTYLFFSWLAVEWIYNTPLKAIIANRIRFLQQKGRFDNVNTTIDQVMKALEEDIRHRCVRNVRAYTDILLHVLEKKNRNDLRSSIAPLHLYLECGASDPFVLGLISVGISRTTALLLSKTAFARQAGTPEEALQQLRSMDINSLPLPEVCKAELRALLGL